jgi:CDGSH-type Zn-finger protein
MLNNMPCGVTLGPGTYHWCSCGKSVREPFCDGSHARENIAGQ